MKEKQTKLATTQEDVYASGKYNKVGDFFIGIGIVWGMSILFSYLSYFIGALLMTLPIIAALSQSLFIIFLAIPIIVALLLARRYFPERKFVRVGIWAGVIIPILALAVLFGACLILFGGPGF